MAKQKPTAKYTRQEVVALRYDTEKESAPRVLAKGQGTIAERILALARENNIPLYEDQDLVELLSVLDLNTEIRHTLYMALAEVLAHIYRANAALNKA